MTIPISSATSERSFSALRRLLTYLQSSMSQQRLNNCLLLYVHKEITDYLDHTLIAKEFIDVNDERKNTLIASNKSVCHSFYSLMSLFCHPF